MIRMEDYLQPLLPPSVLFLIFHFHVFYYFLLIFASSSFFFSPFASPHFVHIPLGYDLIILQYLDLYVDKELVETITCNCGSSLSLSFLAIFCIH